MRHIYAILAGLILMAMCCVSTGRVNAQCVSPSMYFELPVLISGAAGSVNSVYKFDAVSAGVDAFITITGIVGGATLTSMDDNVFGYPAAWQPVVRTPVVQSEGESYITFKVEFKKTSDGSPYLFPCFVMACIDVDGDNDRVREFVAANGHQSYTISNATTLTITTEGSLLRAAGSFNNYPGIDTSAYVTNINYNYANTSGIDEVRIGNITAATYSNQNRYSCLYFKPISMSDYYLLPNEHINLKSKLSTGTIVLNWSGLSTPNTFRFNIERSFDGTHFTVISDHAAGFYAGISPGHYSFNDVDAAKSGNRTVYYRVRQKSIQNNFIYSNQVSVLLPVEVTPSFKITTSPNPFTESVILSVISTTAGTAEVSVISMASGQQVLKERFTFTQGNNSFQLKNVQEMLPGNYVLQFFYNGSVIASQKLIKN